MEIGTSLFDSEEELLNALCQFDFTVSMLRVKKAKEPFPIFGIQGKDHVTPLLGRIAVDPGVAFGYASLFQEDVAIWIQRFDKRMKTIEENKLIGVRYVPKTWREVLRRVGLNQ